LGMMLTAGFTAGFLPKPIKIMLEKADAEPSGLLPEKTVCYKAGLKRRVEQGSP
jgi:hypothetical protein